MYKMHKEKCDICGKEIEGYTINQVKYLIAQHKLTHNFKGGEKNVEKEKQEKN